MKALVQILVMTCFALALSGCDDEWSWHQKLTVSVMTPSGLKAGSSVQRGNIVAYGWWGRQWRLQGSTALMGEATVLEVAPGKFLFALISSTPNGKDVFVPGQELRLTGPTLAALRETRELTRKQYPVLVTFGDINDPTSVKLLDPAHLEASFGSGYRLNSITMKITDEPVTRGRVEEILRWLAAVGNNRGTLIPNPPRRSTDLTDPQIQLLSPLDFSTELYR